MAKVTTEDQLFIFMHELSASHLEAIDIETSHREQAHSLSDPVYGEEHQWAVYLNSLAFATFTQWVEQYHPPQDSQQASGQASHYAIDSSQCSVLNPKYANGIDAVCNLKVNNFNLCLIAAEDIRDEVLTIPCAALDFAQFAAHIYILLEVQEEHDMVLIRGIVRRDQLVEYQKTHHLRASKNLTYSFPFSLVTTDPYRLFYYLQYLNPDAIALPSTQPESTAAINDWFEQYYDWLQASPALDSSGENYSAPQHLSKQSVLTTRFQQIVALLTPTAVDLSKWVDDSIDHVSEQLGFWTTAPRNPEAVFLSSTEQAVDGDRSTLPTLPSPESVEHFERAIAWLKETGWAISDDIQPRYQRFTLNDIPLYLCSLIVAPAGQDRTQLSDGELLILLGTQTQDSLPDGTELQLSTLSGVESRECLEVAHPFLYVRAPIRSNQRIIPTVIVGNHASVLSPYFSSGTKEG